MYPDLNLRLADLTTEARDAALSEIDSLGIRDRCLVQNRLDREVAEAVAGEIDRIALAVEAVTGSIRAGGRLIYVGAGTSGRLGVLDAAECPPTFGTDPNMVQAIIAGGRTALTSAVEGVEDDTAAGAAEIEAKGVGAKDVIVGITASGRTPFVLGAVARAKELGAATIGVTNNRPSELEKAADLTVAVVVGPEFIAGSTRLKAGTAQKLVLNMFTTQAMIELGKTYGNAMVDVMVTNAKLKARAHRLVREITGAADSAVDQALGEAGGRAKLAILMLARNVNVFSAAEMLERAGGKLRTALTE